jgi:hypothetical protein
MDDISYRSTNILPNVEEKAKAMAIDDASIEKESDDQVVLSST